MSDEGTGIQERILWRSLVKDENRKDFFALPQGQQFILLVQRAVIDVYGSSWTTPESREEVARAALSAQERWDESLRRTAHELGFLGGV